MAFHDALAKHLKSTDLLRDAGYVNGNWIGGNGAETFDVFNPATGEKLATLPEMGVTETSAAIDAAYKALGLVKQQGEKSFRDRLDGLTNTKLTIVEMVCQHSLADGMA